MNGTKQVPGRARKRFKHTSSEIPFLRTLLLFSDCSTFWEQLKDFYFGFAKLGYDFPSNADVGAMTMMVEHE